MNYGYRLSSTYKQSTGIEYSVPQNEVPVSSILYLQMKYGYRVSSSFIRSIGIWYQVPIDKVSSASGIALKIIPTRQLSDTGTKTLVEIHANQLSILIAIENSHIIKCVSQNAPFILNLIVDSLPLIQ
jgi:hypothetical protein